MNTATFRAITSIFSGPCIFSWAAKAFLKGVGVLGVGIVTDLRNLGVCDLESLQRIWYTLPAQTIKLNEDYWNMRGIYTILRFLPIILFLVLRCGFFLEWRVGKTPLATHRSRGQGRVIHVQMLRPRYVAWLGKQTDQASESHDQIGGEGRKYRKTSFIYSWWGEWQWLGRCFLGGVWYIFQEGGAGPVAQRRHFPLFFSPPPPNWCLGGFGWVDRSQGGDAAQTKRSAVLIPPRVGSCGVDCVAHRTVSSPLLQDTGVACLALPWRSCRLWHVETVHVAPWNRVLQGKTHLQ